MKGITPISIFLMSLLPGQLLADQQFDIKTLDYSRAKPIERAHPHYPRSAMRQGSEGWVLLSVVIDENGKPQAPVVLESAGHSSFEKAAVKAVKKFTYEPAVLDGKTIESCDNRYMFTFAIGREPGASRTFISKYKRAMGLIEEGDYQAARKIIDKLPSERSFSHYEQAWLSWLTSRYHAAMGNDADEYAALIKGFSFTMSDVMGETNYLAALARMAQLSIKLGDYAASHTSLNKLLTQIDEENQDKYSELYQWAVDAKQQVDGAEYWSSDYSVSDRGFFSTSIRRSDFSVVGDTTGVDNIELRCDAKRMSMNLDEEVTVSVPDSWGRCELFVFGQQGSKLTVVQHQQG